MLKKITKWIFKDNLTGWHSVINKDGKYDLKALSESIKLLIEVNNQEISCYTGYLIALFSIFVPIYIALSGIKTPILVYIILIELNISGIVLLLRKIKNIRKCNEYMLEQYNAIQSESGKSFLVRIDGEKKEAVKTMKKINKKYNFKPIDLNFKGKLLTFDK